MLWVSVITPAKAFLPLIALAVEAAYADVAMTTAIGVSSAAIGTLIAFVKLKDPSSDNVMVVQLNPKAPLETPGGWSPPTTTVYPNAPTGIAASYGYTANSIKYATEAEAQRNVVSMSTCTMDTGGFCQGGVINITSRTTTSNPDTYKITGSIAKTNPADGTVYNFTNLIYYGSYYCDTGYTIAGTYPSQICNVSNNRAVKKPAMGRDMYVRSANTISRDTQQATTDNMSTNSRAATVSTNSVKATNPATGATTTITINSSDGTTTVVTTTPNSDGTTSTVKTTYMSAPDATTGNVYVTGQKTETVNGQGAAAGTSTTPGASTPTTATVDTSSLESKIDSAKSQAASDAAAAKGKLDEIADDLKPSTNVGAPTLPTSLYTPTGKTFGGVLTAFKDNMQQKPFYAAATGFFNVSINGGTCPIWEAQAWVFNIRFDQQCSQTMQQIWPFIYAIVVACAGFLAFRWAFL